MFSNQNGKNTENSNERKQDINKHVQINTYVNNKLNKANLIRKR